MRIISRLDIKNNNLIKSIQFEGVRIVGDPNFYAKKYYDQGIDEIILVDVVATLYGRNNIFEIIKKSSEDIFIPLTVGGGIRSLDDANKVFLSGADKVCINTAAIDNPKFITQLSKIYGSQSVVSYIETKKINNDWLIFTHNGRENRKITVYDWVQKVQEMGAGEILITSVDNEGTYRGLDFELLEKIKEVVEVSIIANGGFKNINEIEKLNNLNIDALAISSALHYEKINMRQIQDYCKEKNIDLRN
jgi:cyclase